MATLLPRRGAGLILVFMGQQYIGFAIQFKTNIPTTQSMNWKRFLRICKGHAVPGYWDGVCAPCKEREPGRNRETNGWARMDTDTEETVG